MNKHTPGPWTLESSPSGWEIRGDGVWVATVMDSHHSEEGRATVGFPSNKEGGANANLIHAAPDLYAALEEMASLARGLLADKHGATAHDIERESETFIRYRETVAKAEGRTP